MSKVRMTQDYLVWEAMREIGGTEEENTGIMEYGNRALNILVPFLN